MKRILYTISAIFIFLWLFVGISADREWGEKSLFIKYRPTFKIYFYSPLGERDWKEGRLTESEQKEEDLFVEFVDKN